MVMIEGGMVQNGALADLESFTPRSRIPTGFAMCYDDRMSQCFLPYPEVMSFYHEYSRRFQRRIRGRVAIFVNSIVQYGIARMTTTVLSPILPLVEIFRTKEEGSRWFRP